MIGWLGDAIVISDLLHKTCVHLRYVKYENERYRVSDKISIHNTINNYIQMKFRGF